MKQKALKPIIPANPLRTEPLVSIVIPVRKINDYIRESIQYILKLDYTNYETLVLPDYFEGEEFPKATIVPTGPIGPAEKRDFAVKFAKGEVLAFLDDDAYPRSDWLSQAIKHFQDPTIGAVGGPALTPDNDNIWQKSSGAVFASPLACGRHTIRYVPGKLQEVDDIPSVNLLVRRDLFEKVGGFDSHYWPGEDTKLCVDIIKAGYRIIYDPDVLVWHHRRSLFLPHLRQVANYALHRGYFAKTFPETSLYPSYFVPSIFVLGLTLGIPLSFAFHPFAFFFNWGILIYGLCLLAGSFKAMANFRSIPVGLLAFPGIFSTHLTYGLYFLKGLMAKELKR